MNLKLSLVALGLIGSAIFSGPSLAVDLNEQAPDFTLPTLAGNNLRLEEQRGKVVLVNFWATWCGPCRQEMPILDRIHARYADLGFTVLGVNIDEDSDKARKIIDRLGVDFPVVLDSQQSTSEQYEVSAMPYTVLINQNGDIEYIHKGYKPGDESEYINRLKSLLTAGVR